MDTPIVDMIIAVHTASRPVSRAVRSILDHTDSPVRVIVVAHNIDPAVIAGNLGELAADPRVLLLDLADGIPSPAGPMNLGIENVTADFFGVMGSDDELEPHALDSWLELQKATGAAVVMARIRHIDGQYVLTPVRPRRSARLDPVKDRLSYRSAPLGMIARAQFGHLRFPQGLESGEDIPFVTSLWFGGHGIAYDRAGPAYLVHSDAGDRVTFTPRPVARDFAFMDLVLDAPEFASLNRAQRNAIAVKLLRTHLFDAIVNRAAIEWADGEREALAAVARRIIAWGAGPERYLSRLDRQILDGVLDSATPVPDIMSLIGRRWAYRTLAVVLPRNPTLALASQAPMRTYLGGLLL